MKELEVVVPITEKGMSYLAKIKTLESFRPRCDSLDDNLMRILSTLPALKRLYLTHTQVNASSLQHLAKLETLQFLFLGVDTTEDHLRYLGQLKNLRELVVSKVSFPARTDWVKINTNISESCLSSIKELHELERLSIYGADLNDTDVLELKSLRNLKRLDLTGMHITEKGVERLKQVLPECEMNIN